MKIGTKIILGVLAVVLIASAFFSMASEKSLLKTCVKQKTEECQRSAGCSNSNQNREEVFERSCCLITGGIYNGNKRVCDFGN